MTYNVQLTPSFKHSVKKLKRRYMHIQDDIRDGVELLLQIPKLALLFPTVAVSVRFDYPTEMQNGAKVAAIACFITLRMTSLRHYICCLYSKSDRADVTQRELMHLLDEVRES